MRGLQKEAAARFRVYGVAETLVYYKNIIVHYCIFYLGFRASGLRASYCVGFQNLGVRGSGCVVNASTITCTVFGSSVTYAPLHELDMILYWPGTRLFLLQKETSCGTSSAKTLVSHELSPPRPYTQNLNPTSCLSGALSVLNHGYSWKRTQKKKQPEALNPRTKPYPDPQM